MNLIERYRCESLYFSRARRAPPRTADRPAAKSVRARSHLQRWDRAAIRARRARTLFAAARSDARAAKI